MELRDQIGALDSELEDFEDEDTVTGVYLTFHLGDREYGLEVRNVHEIIGMQAITEIPDMPDYVMGVINLRGRVVPVIDMRRRFLQNASEFLDRTCIVITNCAEHTVGLIVDGVREVLKIPAAQLEPVPQLGTGGTSRYIKAVGKVADGVKIIVDIDNLLNDDALDASLAEGAQTVEA